VPIYLECGPVALWWCYWGKRGDLRVAFFLNYFRRDRENLGEIRPQLMRQNYTSRCPRNRMYTLYRYAPRLKPFPYMGLLYTAAASQFRLVVSTNPDNFLERRP